jgi:RNA polymerase sigma-70 factor (ECF subfamily)
MSFVTTVRAAPRLKPESARREPALTPAEFAQSLRECQGLLATLAAAVLGERDEAQDAVQEASVIALQKLASFERGTSFRAWMARIVRFVALNQLRRRGGADPMAPEDLDAGWGAQSTLEPEPDRGALLELADDQRHFDDEVIAALRMLTPVARACLLLRTVHELDYRELSALLGVPEGTAMSHVHRAREALRERLTERSPEGDDGAGDRT